MLKLQRRARWRTLGMAFALASALLWGGLTLLAWDEGVDGASVPDVPGSLSGTVYNVDGAPVPGIEVTLHRNPNLTSATKTTTTDAQGAYTFTLLSTGLYRLSLSDPSGTYATPQYYQNAGRLVEATEIPVMGEAVTGVDIVLQEGGRIRGRVTAPDGSALANVDVYVRGSSYITLPNTTTGPDGRYEANGLGSGFYYVEFRDGTNRHFSRYYPNAEVASNDISFLVRAGTVVENIDGVLPRGGTIQGTILGSDGAPLGGIRVRARERVSYSAGRTVTSNPDGTYTVGPLLTGNYKLEFSDPSGRYEDLTYFVPGLEGSDEISVIAGEDVTGIDVTLDKRAAFQGRVTSEAGAPLEGIRVRALRQGQSINSTGIFTYTDAQGNYLLEGLPPQTLIVEFSNPDGLYQREFYSNALTIDAATLVTAFPKMITDVHASLTLGGAITGTVTDTASSRLYDVYVYAFDITAPPTATAVAADVVRLAQGETTYTLGGLEPGDYRILASNLRHFEYFDNVTARDSAAPVRVTLGEFTRNVNFVLGDNADFGVISGTVRSPAGDPLSSVSVIAYRTGTTANPGAPVEAIPVATPTPGGDVNPWRYVASGFTDSEGRYKIQALPPDTYRLSINPPASSGYAFEYYEDAVDLKSASDIELASRQRLGGIDVALDDGGTLSGTVAFADGTPVTQGAITYYFWNGYNWTQIGNDSLRQPMGSYGRSGLQSGRYRIGVGGTLQGELFIYYYGDATELPDAADVAVTAGEATTGVDVRIPTDVFFNGMITGTAYISESIAGPDVPAAGVRVVLYDANSLSSFPIIHATTDAQGRYIFAGLQADDYIVGFEDPTGARATVYNGQESTFYYARLRSEIRLRASQTISNVDARLGLGGAIQGRVTNSEKGLSDIRIEAQTEVNGRWVQAYPWFTTDDDGNYSLTGLAPGTYRLYFSDLRSRYRGQYYGGTDAEDAENVVVIASETTPNIDVALTSYNSRTPRAYLPIVGR